jgi:hypothetical protein
LRDDGRKEVEKIINGNGIGYRFSDDRCSRERKAMEDGEL